MTLHIKHYAINNLLSYFIYGGDVRKAQLLTSHLPIKIAKAFIADATPAIVRQQDGLELPTSSSRTAIITD